MSRKGLNEKYAKSYFQGANHSDTSIFIKTPNKTECKNIKTQSKKKKRKK